jgi:DNA-binding NarL/FixJ family response regulator
MDLVLMTPVRLMGDGLAALFFSRAPFNLCAVVPDLNGLRAAIDRHQPQLALIDVTIWADLHDFRNLAVEWPSVLFVALGLLEQRRDVISCGRAGFAGYVTRDIGADALCAALEDIVAGKLACPAEIASGLLRALSRSESLATSSTRAPLTRRESEVLALVARGLSNKEIARALQLSVATVKRHVHSVLEKMKLQRRTQVVRHAGEAPWLVTHNQSALLTSERDS